MLGMYKGECAYKLHECVFGVCSDASVCVGCGIRERENLSC